MHRFIVTIYSRSIRRCYDIVIEAVDANIAWAKAEYMLGWPNLDNRAWVEKVRPAI